MEIKSFAEMKPSVWKKMQRPWIAVYQREVADGQKPILAKVYDGDAYTEIFMQAMSFEEMMSDAERFTPLEYAVRGAEDPEELLCAYV